MGSSVLENAQMQHVRRGRRKTSRRKLHEKKRSYLEAETGLAGEVGFWKGLMWDFLGPCFDIF